MAKPEVSIPGIEAILASPFGVSPLESNVPALCKEEESIMGIDEAGRGPVLGPMVYGTCYCPLSRKEQLKELQFADSKVLNEAQRDSLFNSIKESNDFIGWKVAVISPSYISNRMLQRSKYSLNEVSHDAAIDLIRRVIADGVKLTEVYVDTVGDPTKYQAKLSKIYPQLQITVTKKADSLFPIVSAASICAKVIRDYVLKNWQFVENGFECSGELGSGYPGDPKTKKWLTDNLDPVFGYPNVVRFSWSTCQERLDKKALPVTWPDDEEADQVQAAVGCAKISQFFGAKPTPKTRHRFFQERGLKTVTSGDF